MGFYFNIRKLHVIKITMGRVRRQFFMQHLKLHENIQAIYNFSLLALLSEFAPLR